MMTNKIVKDVLLVILASIFCFALMFTFIELPRLLDEYLQNEIGFPEFDQGMNEFNAYKAELYIDRLHLRWIGYGCMLLVIGLIILGYLSRINSLAWGGAFLLFLPVFGQFALSMFYLAGLGILRSLWFPFFDLSNTVLELGNIIYVPYWIIMWLSRQFGWYPHQFVSYLLMGMGSVLFVWGVIVWMRARSANNPVAQSWIYRISRHPQYLGWIIWSYGLMLFSSQLNLMKKTWSVPSSLPWLLATMIIIGICLLEEIRMKQIYGVTYENYRKKTPFLFPLPKWLRTVLVFPIRLITKRKWPQTRSQVAGTFLIYTAGLMVFSLLWIDFGGTEERAAEQLIYSDDAARNIDFLVTQLERLNQRRQIDKQIEVIGQYGQYAVQPLLALLDHPNSVIREFAVIKLGKIGDTLAIDPTIGLLTDPEVRVRRGAAWTLGKIGSQQAIEPLINRLERAESSGMRYAIFMALGEIGSPAALPILISAIEDSIWYINNGALAAMYNIDRERSIEYILKALAHSDYRIRRQTVMILLRDPHPDAIDAIKRLIHDPDYETRFYSRELLKQFEARIPTDE
jgi:protein-S-isoprenylcysteine O-methyltransferase Ste14